MRLEVTWKDGIRAGAYELQFWWDDALVDVCEVWRDYVQKHVNPAYADRVVNLIRNIEEKADEERF